MPMSGMLRRLLLAGTCLCVYGTPVHLSNFTPTQDSGCERECGGLVETLRSTHTRDVESKPVSGLISNVGGGGGAGPNGGPEGIASATQIGNGDSVDGRSRPGDAGGDAWSQKSKVKRVRSTSETGDDGRQSVAATALSLEAESREEDRTVSASAGGIKQQDLVDMTTSRLSPDGLLSSTEPTQLVTSRSQQNNRGRVDRARLETRDPETNSPSSTERPNPVQRSASHSPVPPSVFVSPGATLSSLPEPLLPEIGPNLMPREDGPENLWTEAARPGGADTVEPLSQDEATEGTMSSEALPLIFEPFEDVTPEEAAAAAVVTPVSGSTQPPAAMATGGMPLSEVDLEQLVTVETDTDGPSQTPPLLMPDWTSPWQTSGVELKEVIGSSIPSVSQRRADNDDHSERVAVRTPNLEGHLTTAGPSLASSQHAMTTVTMAAHQSVHKSRSGLEEMDSEEEPDEDEEDESSEESVEDQSEEDLTNSPKTFPTQPPYSLIPPPPVWVQRNQGLMQSWVELIREKAGYVSGMLAPVGIGITGALLIVGALYSIRMIHRKRRNSFKHQRRKVRQPEQPREPGTSCQDQAMLLADSSEDEF